MASFCGIVIFSLGCSGDYYKLFWKLVVLYLVDGLLLQGPLSGPGPDLHQAGIPALLGHLHSPLLPPAALGLFGLHYFPL